MQFLQAKQIIVVTNCTARKSQVIPKELVARRLPKGTVDEVAREWKRRLARAQVRVPAAELYQGRGFKEATRAARLAGTSLQVVSAGLGLISEEERVPPYSLTISRDHPDSIARKVNNGDGFQAAVWWGALRARTLVDLVRTNRGSLILLALSSSYLELLLADLAILGSEDIGRMRLVGPRRDADVPALLRDVYLPYDDRLNGEASPIKGTESDFPQRAAFHFVQMVASDPHDESLARHRALVSDALAKWPRKETPVRKRLPEDDLRRAVERVLRECKGRRDVALRRLRHVKNIACEQKRFYRICDQVLMRRA